MSDGWSVGLRGLFLGLALGSSGCGLYAVNKLSKPENVIMTPGKATTSWGKTFAEKHQPEMLRVFSLLHSKYNSLTANFIVGQSGYAIGAFKGSETSDDAYFGATVHAGTTYNTLQTNFGQRASTTFIKHGREIVRDILSARDVFSDDRIKGVVIGLGWNARDFLVSRDFGGAVEAVQIFATKADCDALLNNEITNQEFTDRSKVLGFQGRAEIGRIKLDMSSLL